MKAQIQPYNLTWEFVFAALRAPFLFGLFVMLVSLVTSGCAGIAASNQPTPPSTPQLLVVPGNVDFKTVVVGDKNSQTVLISNIGKAALHIGQIKILGGGFSLEPVMLPLVLQPGQNQNITMVFNPLLSGKVSGTLSINSNDPHPSIDIPIAGQGTPATPQLQVSPSSVSFGKLTLQTVGKKNVTLSNTGNVNLRINGITVSGLGFGFSGLTPGFSLSPRQQVTFQVWSQPHVQGTVSGALSVTSLDLPSPVTMSLASDGTSTTTLPASSHSVKLIWDAGPGTITGYEVYRSDASGGPFSRINLSPVDAPTYVDGAVNSASTYFYVVTARNILGLESNFSNEIFVTIPAQ